MEYREVCTLDHELSLANRSIDNTTISFASQTKSTSLSRNLPVELLRYVFLLCLPARWQSTTFKGDQIPSVLTQICRNWRTIALSMSSLWSSLIFDVKLHSPVLLAETWLFRAQSFRCPINFILPRGMAELRCEDAAIPVMRLLSVQSERWQHIDLGLCAKMVESFGDIKGRLSNLETAKFRSRQMISACIADKFEIAPRLCCISLPSHRKYPQSPPQLPVVQLTKLVVKGPGVDIGVIFQILRSAANLEELCIIRHDREKFPTNIPLQHNNIQSFSIDSKFSLFPYITLPAVQTIIITNRGVTHLDSGDWRDQLLSFFSRSQCSLRSLTLNGPKFEPSDIIKCLECMPTLITRLELGGLTADVGLTDLTRRLTITEGYDPLLPLLEEVNFDTSYLRHLSDGHFPKLFIKMLQSRQESVLAQIRTITLVVISQGPGTLTVRQDLLNLDWDRLKEEGCDNGFTIKFVTTFRPVYSIDF